MDICFKNNHTYVISTSLTDSNFLHLVKSFPISDFSDLLSNVEDDGIGGDDKTVRLVCQCFKLISTCNQKKDDASIDEQITSFSLRLKMVNSLAKISAVYGENAIDVGDFFVGKISQISLLIDSQDSSLEALSFIKKGENLVFFKNLSRKFLVLFASNSWDAITSPNELKTWKHLLNSAFSSCSISNLSKNIEKWIQEKNLLNFPPSCYLSSSSSSSSSSISPPVFNFEEIRNTSSSEKIAQDKQRAHLLSEFISLFKDKEIFSLIKNKLEDIQTKNDHQSFFDLIIQMSELNIRSIQNEQTNLYSIVINDLVGASTIKSFFDCVIEEKSYLEVLINSSNLIEEVTNEQIKEVTNEQRLLFTQAETALYNSIKKMPSKERTLFLMENFFNRIYIYQRNRESNPEHILLM